MKDGLGEYVGGMDVTGKVILHDKEIVIENLPTITNVVPNLWISPTTGQLYRINA